MERLFSYGYSAGQMRDLDEAVRGGALVVDVRHVPYARDKAWNREALRERFGSSYVHLKALGNRAYKTDPSRFELVDVEAGMEELGRRLERRPCVLLCTCADHFRCHRSLVGLLAEERWPGLEWHELMPGYSLDGEWLGDDPVSDLPPAEEGQV